jgi:aromatic-L-amino-acid/L-tryptophan decarboxylase
MDPETFRALGHRLVDLVADLLGSLPHRPVTPGETPSAVRRAFDLDGPLPEEGMDADLLLERTSKLLFDHSLFNGHPRFFGYITSSPAPIGMLSDLLAAAINPNVGAWILSPAATEIESQTVRWIAELMDYPRDCGGILVSGGNMANIVCFMAARHAAAADIRERGAAGTAGRRLRMYGSAETHTWIQKAADMGGLGTASIRWVPTDATLRMDVAALCRQIDADIADGDLPWLVSAPQAPSAPVRSIRSPRSRRFAGRAASGFTWMAHTGLCRDRARHARRPPGAQPRRFDRRGSAQVALRAARSGLCAGA